ncbi:MAG: hypothetical protein GX294_07840 [Candidatus Cloacimonetes bacterium]|nr:hypothetical protein [Candidatus Cloacimonadota bacterium]
MKRLLLTLMILLTAYLVFAQRFDIEAFSDSTKYGWKDYADRSLYRQDLLERQELLHIYEMEANSMRDSVLKSMAVPGWGQFANKAPTKGSIFLASEVVLMGVSLYFYDRSLYYYDKYMNANQVEDIESYYNLALAPRQYSMLFLGTAALVWAYNIFDVIQVTGEHNARVWERLMEKHRSSRVNLTGNGLEVRF